MKKSLFLPVMTGILATIILIACQKDNSENKNTTLKVKMTDAPILADSVIVDIRQVRVNFRNDSSGWVDLNTYAGVYDLLQLQNGVDTLLAAGVIPSNDVKEIRFVLGTNNSIVVAGVSYPLTIPSGAESGLKIKINKQLNGPVDSILIDFDAAMSIHQTGAGVYKLMPVLKIK